MRALVALATLAAALSLAGTAAAAGPIKVVFKTETPAPKVTVKWPYTLTVTAGGKPAKGLLTATLLDPIGQVHQVMDDALKPIKNRPFNSVFSDKILFPAEARGFTLVVSFAVTVGTRKTVTVVKMTPK
jgi:hypothetical protein